MIRVGYATAGLLIGGMWAWDHGEPWWGHLLRVAVLLLVAPPLVHAVRQRRDGTAQHRLPLRWFMLAKVGLVIAALTASLLLTPYLAHPDLPVGAALLLVVSLGGPAFHRQLERRARMARVR